MNKKGGKMANYVLASGVNISAGHLKNFASLLIKSLENCHNLSRSINESKRFLQSYSGDSEKHKRRVLRVTNDYLNYLRDKIRNEEALYNKSSAHDFVELMGCLEEGRLAHWNDHRNGDYLLIHVGLYEPLFVGPNMREIKFMSKEFALECARAYFEVNNAEYAPDQFLLVRVERKEAKNEPLLGKV